MATAEGPVCVNMRNKMAAPMGRLCQVMSSRMCLVNSSYLPKRTIANVSQHRYSIYSPNYVEPATKKDAYDEGRLPFDVSTPIKAAPLWATSSFTHDPLVLKFINIVQEEGKKDLASSLIRKAFEVIKLRQVEKINTASPEEPPPEIEANPLNVFYGAVDNCKPVLGLQSVKKGGQTYQVPTPLKVNRRRFLAMKWLIEASNTKDPETPFYQKLANELMDAHDNTGVVVKRKNDLHKQCEANRAYAHFRWW